MAGRFSSPYGLTAAATLPQELNVLHVDVIAVAGLPGLSLVGACATAKLGTKVDVVWASLTLGR